MLITVYCDDRYICANWKSIEDTLGWFGLNSLQVSPLYDEIIVSIHLSKCLQYLAETVSSQQHTEIKLSNS